MQNDDDDDGPFGWIDRAATWVARFLLVVILVLVALWLAALMGALL